jgi:hypothetical protein
MYGNSKWYSRDESGSTVRDIFCTDVAKAAILL